MRIYGSSQPAAAAENDLQLQRALVPEVMLQAEQLSGMRSVAANSPPGALHRFDQRPALSTGIRP
jgi:hypothetical protein